jgi:glycosyltransferase involved in cell wall biosynthesis
MGDAMDKMTELDVSVIIPTHNEAANICNLVAEIVTIYPDVEEIVGDRFV